MKVLPTELPGVVLIEPAVYRDQRGFFLETYHAGKYRAAGVEGIFVQDNQSHSIRGTVRGLHAQRHRQQGKLVRVLRGEIFDVAVDIRRHSPSFRRWVGVRLSAESFLQIYIPPGFAHGFCVLSETAEVEYKCTELYDPADEFGILWNDPELGITWPVHEPILSEKDRTAPRLAELTDRLPVFQS
ncbi:MAG: dTDP-4-dehydrorhamnose 3,5-epimerase [Deltaproteobacteria bacterium]|nr:dTDP-4-dehydrorhamnose 3,5-epimerase [Deltaproteobacteria bacterium]